MDSESESEWNLILKLFLVFTTGFIIRIFARPSKENFITCWLSTDTYYFSFDALAKGWNG